MPEDIDEIPKNQTVLCKRSSFEYLFHKFNTFYENIFAHVGQQIGSKPVIFILLSFLLTALCALGFFRFQMIDDADALFIPIGSKSVRDREILAKILPMKYDRYYLHQDYDLGLFGDVIFMTKDHRNIDRMAIRMELKRIYHLIEKINVTYENRTYFYRDLCAKRQNECVVDGAMYFRDTFWQRLKEKQLDRYLLNGMYTDDDAEPNLLSFIFGKKMDLQTKEGKLFSRILKIHFNLRRTQRVNGEEKNIEVITRMWEQAFLEFFKNFESVMVHTIYSVSNSIDQELANNISLDMMLVVVTFIVMIFVATICLSLRTSFAQSPVYLSVVGVLATLLGLISGFGFCLLIGIPMCLLVLVTPFLIIGVGTDDMFLIYSAYRRTKTSDTTVQRLAETFRICGSGITITSLTNIIAFLAGATTNFYGIRLFCIHTSATIAFCYIYQVILFGSSVALHNECINNNRHTLLLYMINRDESTDHRKRGSQQQKHCLRWKDMLFYIVKQLFTTPGQILIGSIFLIYTVVAIYGAIQIKDGMQFGQLLNDKSYAKHYFDTLDQEFELYPLVQFIIHEPIPYWRTDYMKRIGTLVKKAKDLDGMNPTVEISWFSLLDYDPQDYPLDNGTKFMEIIRGFVNLFPVFANDLVMNDTHLLVSRFYLKIGRIFYNSSDGHLVNQLRSLAEQSQLPIIVHSSLFKYYEQMYEVIPNIIQTFAIALAAMYIATFLLIPDLKSVMIVIGTMCMILVSLVAVLSAWGIQASAVMMVELVMSVGFCSDFCVHIVHAFLTATGTRRERAQQALIQMGIPILCASLSSIIGVIFLGFAQSYLFQTFFKTIISIMTLGTIHALCFLPVILSVIGSHWPSHLNDELPTNNCFPMISPRNSDCQINGHVPDESLTNKWKLSRTPDTIEEEDDELLSRTKLDGTTAEDKINTYA